tara:strand:+ start:1793 stop:1954 length:162 start_codon:yes stop_codon:yes gene_type:complete
VRIAPVTAADSDLLGAAGIRAWVYSITGSNVIVKLSAAPGGSGVTVQVTVDIT